MMTLSDQIDDEDMIFTGEPDIAELQKYFQEAVADTSAYREMCWRSFEYRMNAWPGKTWDLRKHGPKAFPWENASDTEALVIEERIQALLTSMLNALSKAHIRAYGVNTQDLARASTVSTFLKWMSSSYIKNFMETMEQDFNHLLEKGIAVSYVGWSREMRSMLQTLTMDEIAQAVPEMANMIADPANDDMLATMLTNQFGIGLTMKRAKKALRDLRNKRAADIPFSKPQVDRPDVRSCLPDGDVLFPPYTMDIQRAPYVFYRVPMTAQEIRKKVSGEGWNSEWADYVIDKCRGLDMDLENPTYNQTSASGVNWRNDLLTQDDQLVTVVYCYQRLIDEEDGGEGIYLTVFQPSYTGNGSDAPAYATHELISGMDDYPFIVTKLSQARKRLYDVQTVPMMLRGAQFQVKTERDSRIDRASLSTNPPLEHPVGKPPSRWGPGAWIGYRRQGETRYADIPKFDPASIEVEQTMLKQADDILGLDPEKPSYAVRQQYFINKALDHACKALAMSFKMFQRFGPDEVFFQVTGTPGQQQMTKGDPNEDYTITVQFDAQNTDPETSEKKLVSFTSLVPMDHQGRIDVGKLVEMMAYAIDPAIASYVVQPPDAAQANMVRSVTDDLTKIYSGVEVGAQPTVAQVAMQAIQRWAQQPDVAQQIQSNQPLQERLQKYVGQYQMQIDQAQNATIGRLGTAPAQFQGTNTGPSAQQ